MGGTNDLDGRDVEPSAISNPEPDSASGVGYRVICISMYHDDLAWLDEAVAALKARGIRRANRSWLIRKALGKLDLDALSIGDRP